MQVTFKNDILDEVFSISSPAPDGGTINVPEGLPDVYSAFGGRVVLINYSGQISLASMGLFKPALFETLTGNAEDVVLGLENVSDVSRSALGTLVDFASAVLGRGKRLYLLSPPGSLKKGLKELQLTMFFKILDNQDELLCMLPDE